MSMSISMTTPRSPSSSSTTTTTEKAVSSSPESQKTVQPQSSSLNLINSSNESTDSVNSSNKNVNDNILNNENKLNNNNNNNNNNNKDDNNNTNEIKNTNSANSTSSRRVKLYTLSSDKWIDCGTGYCSGKLDPYPHFYVINENDSNDILLNSPIQGSTQYQRQQDTLIVWTNEDGIDYALSFEETDGCLELCEFLIYIQKDKIAPNITLVAIIQSAEGEITEIIAGPIPELPLPTLNNLGNILDILTISQFKNKIILQILDNNGNWLNKLITIFKECEKNHQLSNIYCLNDIIKTLVYFNEIDLFELMINNDLIISIIGILEYEPEFPGFKMNWRDFLNDKFKFKEVIKLNNVGIENEIKKCYILKFLKDTVLARLLDDSGFNCISTMIQNKECKILEFMENDNFFLNSLFKIYENDDDDNNEKKIDGIKLINQYVLISKNQQPFQRTAFYKALIDKGLMSMVKFSTAAKEVENRILITEVIVTIIEHDLLLFRNSNEEILMNTLINTLLNENNIGLKTQAFEAIKILIDPNNLIENNNNNDSNNNSNNNNNNYTNDLIDESYFKTFYENSAIKLFKPILDIINTSTDNNNNNNSVDYKREDLITLENLCELLSFISKFHNILYSRSFILENHLLKGINKLIDKSFKYQLRLSAVRCLRSMVLLNDEFYTRYIIENDIFKGFMEILKESNDCNNLVSSTCLNFLSVIIENLEITNFQLIKKYLVSDYRDILDINLLGKKLLELDNNNRTKGNDQNIDHTSNADIEIESEFSLDGISNLPNNNKRALDDVDNDKIDGDGKDYGELRNADNGDPHAQMMTFVAGDRSHNNNAEGAVYNSEKKLKT